MTASPETKVFSASTKESVFDADFLNFLYNCYIHIDIFRFDAYNGIISNILDMR